MTNVRDSRVMVLVVVVVVYSRFSSTCVSCVFFFSFFNLCSLLFFENSDLQTYRNTASRGADGRSEGNTRARINWILRNQSSAFAVSRRVIKISRKDDAIFATNCAREKNSKEKKIYMYISLEACNYRRFHRGK